jgi:hypothetical protein
MAPKRAKYRMRVKLFLLFGKYDRGSYGRRSGDVSLGLPALESTCEHQWLMEHLAGSI